VGSREGASSHFEFLFSETYSQSITKDVKSAKIKDFCLLMKKTLSLISFNFFFGFSLPLKALIYKDVKDMRRKNEE